MKRVVLGAVAVMILFGIMEASLSALAEGSRLPPMVRKNKNEVTDLFKVNIEDQGGLEQQLNEARELGQRAVENKEASSLLPESGQIEAKANELKDLNQGEAENRGYRVQVEEGELLGKIQINYNDPQVKMHKKDTDRIASASEELLARLADKLRELGVDCRQKKGEVDQEPEAYLHIEEEPEKEVIYDKHLCEYLRSQYSCRDTLSLKCVKKTSGDARAETVRLSYNEMPDYWWLCDTGGGNSKYGIVCPGSWFVEFIGQAHILAELKQKIIEKTGFEEIEIPPQQILVFGQQQVLYQLDQFGNKGHVQGIWHEVPENVTGSIRFFFRVSQEAKCAQWQEDWNEVCSLQ
jgi:hypothetical protein